MHVVCFPFSHLHFRAFFLSKATYSNSYIHSYSDCGGCHARCWPAHQEQVGVSASCTRTLWHADQGNWTHDLPFHNMLALPLSHSCPVLFMGRYSNSPSFLFHIHLHTRLQCADTQTQKQATAAVCVVTMAISSDFLLHSLEWWEVFRYKGETMVMARKCRSCAWGGIYCTGDTHIHTIQWLPSSLEWQGSSVIQGQLMTNASLCCVTLVTVSYDSWVDCRRE